MPQSGIVTETVVATNLVHGWEIGHTAEHRNARALSWVVHREPCDTSDSVRQPATELDNGRVGALRNGDVTHLGNGFIVQSLQHLDFVRTHPRICLRADDGVYLVASLFLDGYFQVLGDVPLGTFISLAEQSHNIGYGNLLFRLHADREFFRFIIQVQGWSQIVEDEEFANAERFLATESLPPFERFLAIPKTETLGHFEHIVRSHAIVLVLQIQGADARNVGRYTYMVVWNTDSRPYTTNLVRTFTEHFEMPYFVRVGNGETFSAIGIAVLLDEFAHQKDRFAGSCTTLENHSLQFLDHEHTVLVHQLFLTCNGGFSDTQLLFVHTRVGGIHESVSLFCLRNFSLNGHFGLVGNELGVHTAVVNGHGSVAFVLLGRNHVYPSAVPAIASVAGDDGTVGGCFLAYHDTGTAFRIFCVIGLGADVCNDK